MILPISKAFQSLKLRLECISVAQYELPLLPKTNSKDLFGEDPAEVNKIPLEEYLKCFDDRIAEIQEFFRKKEEQNSKLSLGGKGNFNRST